MNTHLKIVLSFSLGLILGISIMLFYATKKVTKVVQPQWHQEPTDKQEFQDGQWYEYEIEEIYQLYDAETRLV